MDSRSKQRAVPVRSRVLPILCAFSALLFFGCSILTRTRQSGPLATSLQEIVPHADRDHFVYVWQQFDHGQLLDSGIQVEHVTALGGGEFEVLLSEDGMVVGRTRLRDTGDALLLVSEDNLTQGLRLTYDPPLTQLAMPLFAGARRNSASATMTQLADGQVVGVFPVEQEIRVEPGHAVHSRLGTFPRSIVVQEVRTLQIPDGATELKTTTVLVPGIGEFSSIGSASGAPPLRRELACALIGGRRVGDCTNLNQWRDQSGARSPDVH
jgi:hypothetical protein